MGATNSFIGANFILGQANLINPSYIIERWHTVLVAWGSHIYIATFINLWGSKILDKVSTVALGLQHRIVYCDGCHNSWHATPTNKALVLSFKTFQNFTGFGTAMAGIIGILQPAFGMCCCKCFLHLRCLYSSRYLLIPYSQIAP